MAFCARCGKPIRTAESIARGMGPTCFEAVYGRPVPVLRSGRIKRNSIKKVSRKVGRDDWQLSLWEESNGIF